MSGAGLLARVLRLFRPSRGVRPGPRRSTWRGTIDDPDKLASAHLSVVSPEQFDRAYAEYSEFAAGNRLPIEERWPSVIPDVDRSKYGVLGVQCHDIRWTTARGADHLRSGPAIGMKS